MNEFVDNLKEVFALFGPIQARKMFGGYGIYRDELMFALVAEGELYLKADALSRYAFIERGLPAFEYRKKDRLIKISYYLAPEAVFDDPQAASEWANRAYAAALRGKASQEAPARFPARQKASQGYAFPCRK